MKHVALAHQLDAAADRLTARVLDEMYRDPFWHARFAERADRHGRQDGRFHIDYLIQALHAGDPGILENYARWLQQVLTSRGMCTRHLGDNFHLLGEAIRAEAWPDGDAAIDLLAAARAALVYPPGAAPEAHAVQRHATAIGDAIAHDLVATSVDERRYLIDDLIEYTADAIALAQPAVLARHVAWLADFLAPRGVARDRLAQALRALRTAGTMIAPGAREALTSVIDPALSSVS
ncbi:MAG TPA: hypothetical protein VFP84_20840 [Kofleriaceae bacterium]|nr:hypothetical protein [Kofleriaceae bacterium]